MGQVPSSETITKPEEPTLTFGPWQGAVMMMVGTTLWLSSMTDLPPEGYAFYLVWSRATILGIIAIIGHRMCQGWMYKRSVEVWNAKQIKAKRDKPPNPGETEFSRKMPFSYWEFDKKRREAKTKAISEVLKKKDKAEKERKEIYAERRLSKRIAILALVPLMYSVFRHEMETLLEGKHSTYTHPKRPRALRVNKAPEGQPGMAMSYMYQPVKGGEGGLTDLSRAPILENAPVLLTSTDERYAGDGAKERTVPTWFKYASESSSSKDKDKGGDAKSSSSSKK
ncbi:hypothetical protein QFC21_001109 [Naganishia friedmannii]|uniref:Uncharacterized protein n=1 Tax=Naganishia friedmannii TaxID=89922 RepID=A0ACC2W7B2_9TREE|nr:hypothetical protein QFC21_001109 [Naganishia friedmannii]